MKMAAQSAADVASSAARADGASVEDAGGNGVEAIGSAGTVTKKQETRSNPKQPHNKEASRTFKKNKQENKSIPSIPSINFNINPQDWVWVTWLAKSVSDGYGHMDILGSRSCQLTHLTESSKTSLEIIFPNTMALPVY